MCNFATDIKQLFTTMKQRYAVVVLFALIIASSMVSLTSYKATEELVTEDMNQALTKALDEQQSDVISADTIQVFNKYLQMEALRGRAVLAVDTRREFRPRPQVSTATILSLSDQRPSMILWSMVLLWGMFCLYKHKRSVALGLYGGLADVNQPSDNKRGEKRKNRCKSGDWDENCEMMRTVDCNLSTV